MNMLCRETNAAQPANPPATCITKPRGSLYRQGDTIGPVTLSGALR